MPDEVRDVIRSGVLESGASVPHVPVIPVHELEAWLLVDEKAIRAVVGNPRGTMAIGLPLLSRIEDTLKPKELLFAALASASGKSGRQLERVKANRYLHRAILLERLDTDGPVRGLPAWRALEQDIESAMAALRNTNTM